MLPLQTSFTEPGSGKQCWKLQECAQMCKNKMSFVCVNLLLPCQCNIVKDLAICVNIQHWLSTLLYSLICGHFKCWQLTQVHELWNIHEQTQDYGPAPPAETTLYFEFTLSPVWSFGFAVWFVFSETEVFWFQVSEERFLKHLTEVWSCVYALRRAAINRWPTVTVVLFVLLTLFQHLGANQTNPGSK